MVGKSMYNLDVHKTSVAEVRHTKDGIVKLKILPGLTGNYRLAQLDDCTSRTRNHFKWQPPLTLSLRARVSAVDIPGTWGFGFWNDPFSLSLGFGGATRRFPAPPNAAWFFFASPQNYLSLRNDLPANGFMAQTFMSPGFSRLFLALGAIGLPLLLWPLVARKLRPYLRYLIAEDSYQINIDVTQWHNYTLEWHNELVLFKVDNKTFSSGKTPNGPLCFILWIDNQYASFPSSGKLSYGTLANHQPAWLEIEALKIE
jgi:hypothetical protein